MYGCMRWGYTSRQVEKGGNFCPSRKQLILSETTNYGILFLVFSQYPTVRWPMGVKAGIAGQIKLPAHAEIAVESAWLKFWQNE